MSPAVLVVDGGVGPGQEGLGLRDPRRVAREGELAELAGHERDGVEAPRHQLKQAIQQGEAAQEGGVARAERVLDPSA